MKRERGGAAVEFAIVFPLLLVLLFGIIEFSLILYDKAMITNASREGARAGIVAQLVRMTEPEIKAIVDKYSKDHLISFGGGGSPETEVSWAAGYPPKFGDELTVRVTYPYEFLVFPNLSGITGPIQLTAITVMRTE
jgi:Flp pilus assembly protein TadG